MARSQKSPFCPQSPLQCWGGGERSEAFPGEAMACRAARCEGNGSRAACRMTARRMKQGLKACARWVTGEQTFFGAVVGRGVVQPPGGAHNAWPRSRAAPRAVSHCAV